MFLEYCKIGVKFFETHFFSRSIGNFSEVASTDNPRCQDTKASLDFNAFQYTTLSNIPKTY